jgi:hypothetical protein
LREILMRAGRALAGLAVVLACCCPAAGAEDDAAIEAFLLEARVVSMEEIGTGVTKPKKVLLELDGERRPAAFKTVELHVTRQQRFSRDGFKLNFRDDYRYERAAYLLDRYLGLDMVPVAVLRQIDGQRGALIDWVSDAISEMERRNRELFPDTPPTLLRQRDMMKIFDTLILNEDRHLGNELITLEDWKLHLIDHSRSFRLQKSLDDKVEEALWTLPRRLLERLRSMDREGMTELLGGLLSKAQIKALLARRDRILEKIERDRERYGDDLVFQEAAEESPTEKAGPAPDGSAAEPFSTDGD